MKKAHWTARLDHVAVAVRDPQKLKRVLEIIGLADAGSEPVPSQGILTHFQRAAASESCVEILEVTDSQGVVGKFLEKKGPGIHHISFMVSDLEGLMAELRRQGMRLVYDGAKPGAHATKVNFIHPESTGGVLIEISEKAF